MGTTTNAEAAQLMFDVINESFSSSHEVRQDGNDFHITNDDGKFILKAFVRETIRGSSEKVKQTIDYMFRENESKGIATGFVFLRSVPDYEIRRNKGAFLRQSWDFGVNEMTGEDIPDHYNIKKLSKIERAVERLYDNGQDRAGYKSRVVYFNPVTKIFESVRFREHSGKNRISKTIGYVCDIKCVKGYYRPEEIDFKKCKTGDNGRVEKCTLYARGREKRAVKIAGLKKPLRIDVKPHDNFYLAEIRAA